MASSLHSQIFRTGLTRPLPQLIASQRRSSKYFMQNYTDIKLCSLHLEIREAVGTTDLTAHRGNHFRSGAGSRIAALGHMIGLSGHFIGVANSNEMPFVS